jgi:hypothetical protein
LSIQTINLSIIKLGTKYILFRFWNMNVKVNLIVKFQICGNKWYSCRCAKAWWLFFPGWRLEINMEL